MRIVVDASVLIATVVGEPAKQGLVKATRNADLIAPESVHWEIGNALSAMFKRQRITLEQAGQAIRTYLQIPLRFVEIDLEQSVRLAGELNIYAYDAYLLTCATLYGVPLLTLDHQLAALANSRGINVMEVT